MVGEVSILKDTWCNETEAQCVQGCNDGLCRAYNDARIGGMPLSNREKQEAYRARQAMLGLKEVRGIFLPEDLHPKLKELAQRLMTESGAPPQIERDADGELLIDWSPGPGRMVTLSLRADGRLSYAITWDDERARGTAQMPHPTDGS